MKDVLRTFWGRSRDRSHNVPKTSDKKKGGATDIMDLEILLASVKSPKSSDNIVTIYRTNIVQRLLASDF